MSKNKVCHDDILLDVEEQLANPKGEKKPLFKGKRVARGLYKTGENQLLNADVNGAFNIRRKKLNSLASFQDQRIFS